VIIRGNSWENCSGVCYNDRTHDCCSGVVYEGNSWESCGGTCYDSRIQRCCDNSTVISSRKTCD
jgi:hypothetical protein